MGETAMAAGRRRWRIVLRRRRPCRCEKTALTLALLAGEGGGGLLHRLLMPQSVAIHSVIDVQSSPGTLRVGAVCMRGVILKEYWL